MSQTAVAQHSPAGEQSDLAEYEVVFALEMRFEVVPEWLPHQIRPAGLQGSDPELLMAGAFYLDWAAQME